jgi:hypothetical protein
MLSLYTSNRSEVLAQSLAQSIQETLRSALAPEFVVVQSQPHCVRHLAASQSLITLAPFRAARTFSLPDGQLKIIIVPEEEAL